MTRLHNFAVIHDTRILDIADCIVHMEDGRLTRDTALVGK